jgi:hypothetical protein
VRVCGLVCTLPLRIVEALRIAGHRIAHRGDRRDVTAVLFGRRKGTQRRVPRLLDVIACNLGMPARSLAMLAGMWPISKWARSESAALTSAMPLRNGASVANRCAWAAAGALACEA